MSKNPIIEARESVIGIVADGLQNKEVTRDSIAQIVNGIIPVNEKLTQLDGIVADALGEEKVAGLGGVIADTIMSFTDKVTPKLVYDALVVAQKTMDAIVEKDGVEALAGSEIVANLVKLNIYTMLGADIPFAGDFADMVKDSSANGLRYKMYSVDGVVAKTIGELKEGDYINGITAGAVFALTEREETQKFVTDTLTYTFNLKVAPTDSSNYPMQKAVNEVYIDGVEFNDFGATSTNSIFKAVGEVQGVEVVVTFDYGAGTIKVEFASNITDGTPIAFKGVLDNSKPSEVFGVIKSDIKDATYPAIPIGVNIQTQSLKAREILVATGLNIQSNDAVLAYSKISEEVKFAKIKKAEILAKDYGDALDLTTQTESTVAERYKHFTMLVDSAQGDILAKSGISGQAVVKGGSAVRKIFSGLKGVPYTRAFDVKENTIQVLGEVDGTLFMYDPTHDIRYPKDSNGYDVVFVINNPADVGKKPVISGVGLPIVPDDLGSDANANKTIMVSGEIPISPNKDPRAREQVRKLKVKV